MAVHGILCLKFLKVYSYIGYDIVDKTRGNADTSLAEIGQTSECIKREFEKTYGVHTSPLKV